MIRVMLVDDHTMVREALRLVLEQNAHIEVVFEASDGEMVLQAAGTVLPDIVVMDIALPGQSGIVVTRQLLARHPNIKVLALSTHHDRHIVQQMLDAGASGYIAKSSAGIELMQGILKVMQGHTYLCTEVAALVAENMQQRRGMSVKPDNQTLSRRELQIATLLGEGKPAAAIAKELHISPSTVDVHRRNIMKKLNVHNAVELTKYTIRTGLVLI